MPAPETPCRITALPVSQGLALVESAALTLFENGEDTQECVRCAERLSAIIGLPVAVEPAWGAVAFVPRQRATPVGAYWAGRVIPTAVTLNRVVAVRRIVDALGSDRSLLASAAGSIGAAARLPAANVFVFATACATGGVSLALIFGAHQWKALLLLAISCALGAFVRRTLARFGMQALGQSFAAALLAGLVGAAAVDLQASSELRLVAVCACMILVPGPHILNGAIDVARLAIPLGLSRLAYSGLILIGIGAGLLLGLSIGGTDLPATAAGRTVSLEVDVVAAGVAVASYCVFFSMPWRMLVWPVAVGMLAHALRWLVMTRLGLGAPAGAGVACLVVGAIMAPLAAHLRLPFAGVAFSSVVSLMPGVYVFRLLSGLITTDPSPAGVEALLVDMKTAWLIVMAMAVGLMLPKTVYDHWRRAPRPVVQAR